MSLCRILRNIALPALGVLLVTGCTGGKPIQPDDANTRADKISQWVQYAATLKSPSGELGFSLINADRSFDNVTLTHNWGLRDTRSDKSEIPIATCTRKPAAERPTVQDVEQVVADLQSFMNRSGTHSSKCERL